jgi:hypothetical protein
VFEFAFVCIFEYEFGSNGLLELLLQLRWRLLGTTHLTQAITVFCKPIEA